MRLRLVIPVVAFALLSGLSAPPASARVLRSHRVAGWQVVRDDDSGDRDVFLRRHRRGYRFDFTFEFWRGNGGVSTMGDFSRGACHAGGIGGIVPFAEGMSRRFLDAQIAEYLRACPLPRAEARTVRRSLDAAWPRLLIELRRAKADMEIRQIENYGR